MATLGSKYNLKSPGVKRLMREACELAEPTEDYFACPLDDNLFEWHFTVKGPSSTEFDGGFYHGRILLPTQYPMKPPNIILLTPNGRFETNKKICLSISGYHPETWQPSWSIRTALLALIAFMPMPAKGAIGALSYTPEERKVLAKKSLSWQCDVCGKISEKLLNATGSVPKLTQEENDMIQQIALKSEEDLNKKSSEQDSETNERETPESVLRQRTGDNVENIPSNVSFNTNMPTATNISGDPLQNKDKFWNVLMWFLVSAIVFLIARRIFFI